MCIWFDTHFHLSHEAPEAAPGILAEARSRGVQHFLLQGTSREDRDFVSNLAQREEGVLCAIGLHPEAAEEFEGMDEWRSFYENPRTVAVGEIGLDYHYAPDTAPLQRRVFAEFLRLAAELGLPAVIHCRDAFEDCYAIVKENLPSGAPFVIHSFTGTREEARAWLSLGAHISVNGMLTFKKADNIREAIAIVPLERLLLETDSPYLAPVPLRGHENTPANIPIIGEYLADFRFRPVAEIASITTANGLRLFSPKTR